jgi:hypothetical protein
MSGPGDKMPQMKEEVEIGLGPVEEEKFYTLSFTEETGITELTHCNQGTLFENVVDFTLAGKRISKLTITKEKV